MLGAIRGVANPSFASHAQGRLGVLFCRSLQGQSGADGIPECNAWMGLSLETAGIIAIALAGFGFAVAFGAVAIRSGTLRVDKTRLLNSLLQSEKESAETRAEFDRYRERAAKQLEKLRDDLNDSEDMLAACTDPAVVHDELDRVFGEATRGLSDPRPD